MTVQTDRLSILNDLTLDRSSHASFDEGHCAMEVVAYIADEPHTDHPTCASPVLTGFVINLNDRWDKDTRQQLKPYLPRLVGTRDGQDEARSYLALDWLIRTYTPAWLDLAGLAAEATALRDLRRIVDLVSAQAAGPVVRDGQKKAAAAWDAARDAARDAAGSAAGDAARAAAGDAARAAAVDAAWNAARAAAWDAAVDAAWAAAGAALNPTVTTLQASALDLLDRMIDPSAVTE